MNELITKINLSVKNGKGKVITNGSVANILIDLSKVKQTVSGGGSNLRIAYCKEDAPDTNEIICYLDTDLLNWDDSKTYAAGNWIEVTGTEYKSLQNDNTNHVVSDGEWWEEGTLSITIKCLIINGSSLMYAAPFLHDGDPIIIGKITINGSPTWYCTNIEFNGARFSS